MKLKLANNTYENVKSVTFGQYKMKRGLFTEITNFADVTLLLEDGTEHIARWGLDTIEEIFDDEIRPSKSQSRTGDLRVDLLISDYNEMPVEDWLDSVAIFTKKGLLSPAQLFTLLEYIAINTNDI